MKATPAVIGTSALLLLSALTQPLSGQSARENGGERIGIYDSRAIAIAYVGSAFHEQRMTNLVHQFQKAKEGGNAKEIARLEAEGKALQTQLHHQGFGTAPVDDILGYVASDLPRIERTAGVSRLVSKWDKAELRRHAQARQVDVTMLLVDAFHPSEKQRKRAIEIQEKSPQKIRQ